MVDINFIKKNIDKLKQLGTSESQAINTIAKKFNLDPYEIYDILYPNNKTKEGYKDVKFNEGDFVSVNGSKDVYEVINITNKDSIVLRNVNDNSQIRKTENDLSLVKNRNTMENGMKKINEAQYNISINGLETDDAETLSQMLSLAGQAEGSNSSPEMSQEMPTDDNGFNDEEDFGSDIEAPIDVNDEEDFGSQPMGDELPPMDSEEPMDDIDMGYEPSMGSEEIPSMDSEINAFDDMGAFDETMTESCKVKEDVLLDKSQKDPTIVAKEKEKDETLEEDSDVEIAADDLQLDEEDEDIDSSMPTEDIQINEDIDNQSFVSYNVYEIENEEVSAPKSFDRIEDAEEYANKIFSGNKDAVIMGVDENGNEMELGDKGNYVHSENNVTESFDDVKKKFTDAMPKAGAFRDDEDKIEGVFFGNGSDELMDAAKEMAYKLRDQGKNIGYISKKEVEEYIARGHKLEGEEEYEDDSYDFEDEDFEEDLDEGFKDNMKKAGKYVAGAALGAGMMANANANNLDPMYDGATNPGTEYSELYNGPHNEDIKTIHKDGTVEDIYGNKWTYDEWQQIQNGEDPLSDNEVAPDIDEAMNEMLRYAGVELSESDEPEIVDDETLYYNKDEEDGKQKYKEVKTVTDFGKDSSEGMKRPMNLKLESNVSKDKIKSICETASKMYAKKESSEWLKLDRRYIDKLIKEGVGYSNASKMIIECKKKH